MGFYMKTNFGISFGLLEVLKIDDDNSDDDGRFGNSQSNWPTVACPPCPARPGPAKEISP